MVDAGTTWDHPLNCQVAFNPDIDRVMCGDARASRKRCRTKRLANVKEARTASCDVFGICCRLIEDDAVGSGYLNPIRFGSGISCPSAI